MAYSEGQASAQQVNRNAAAVDPKFVEVNFGIKNTDEETRNVISATFGVIKNSIESLWYSVGLDPNVNMAYEKTMMDPNNAIEVQGKLFYPHPGVGNLRAYNESGNPSGGCFSMQTLA